MPCKLFYAAVLVFGLHSLLLSELNAQCVAVTTNNPYRQGFEASNGNWMPGGIGSDWQWGIPRKAVITRAGSGSKCWITGETVGNSYADNERSWLESPCMDMTAIEYPFIEFKLFWEMENVFDGAALQYKIGNGGWQDVGAANETENCLLQNWYNTASITNLNRLNSAQEGWSGNIQSTSGVCRGGGGKGMWLVASHPLPEVARRSNVRFRFIFGAGSTCNNYDGFAIDDIFIGNAPANKAAFTFSCNSSRTISFINASDACATTYNWNFGETGSLSNTSTVKNPSHTYLFPGTYTVTLTASSPGNAPAVFSRQVNIVYVKATEVNAVGCFNTNTGSVQAVISNANSLTGLNYSWNTSPVSTTPIIANVPAGTYTVTVTADDACTVTSSITLSNPPPLTHSSIIVDAQCESNNGSATLTESGGTQPYTYLWSPNVSSSANANNLAAGKYLVTVTDAHKCVDTIHLEIRKAGALTASISSKTNVTCFGGSNGSAVVSATGTGALTYQWAPSGGTQRTATNLNAGNYTVVVADQNGCSAQVSTTINQPATPLIADLAITHTSCGLNNGELTATASGGTAPYTFTLGPAGLQGAHQDSLAPGDYTLTVTDAAGCIKTVPLVVNGSTAPVIANVDIQSNCNPGSDLEASVQNGTLPYTFSWVDGATIYGGNPVNSALPGTYTLTVIDGSGCSTTKSVAVSTPSPLKHSVSTVDLSCSNAAGRATLNVVGGVAPYSYKWPANQSTGPSATGLFAGDYQVIIADARGCSDTAIFTIKNTSSFAIEPGQIKDATCYGGSDGRAEIRVSGPGENTFSWSPSGGVTATANNLKAGEYQVTVTNSLGCKGVVGVTINQPPPISASIANIINASCFGQSDGSATAIVGRPGTFSYSWAPAGGNSATAAHLPAGSYTVTVTDSLGCTAIAGATIMQPAPLRVSLGNDTALCPGSNFVLSPGIFSSYTWHDNSHTSTYNVSQAGIYRVTVANSAGCTASSSVNVKSECFDIVFSSAFTPNGDGRNDGFGPLGTISATHNYVLNIYNRWGQRVFYSTNPSQKWDGRFKGTPQGTGTYIWTTSYSFNGSDTKFFKGSVMLIR